MLWPRQTRWRILPWAVWPPELRLPNQGVFSVRDRGWPRAPWSENLLNSASRPCWRPQKPQLGCYILDESEKLDIFPARTYSMNRRVGFP